MARRRSGKCFYNRRTKTWMRALGGHRGFKKCRPR